MEVIVCRSFMGAGKKFTPGQRVHADDWKNLELLLEQRFVRLAGDDNKPVEPAKARTKTSKADVEESAKASSAKPKKRRAILGPSNEE